MLDSNGNKVVCETETYSPTFEEWNFISSISNRFPEYSPSILQRFRSSDLKPQEVRAYESLIGIKDEPRRGLLQRGLEAGSVYTHTRRIPVILGKIFRESAELKAKYHSIAPTSILVHDLGEDYTGDFTPLDANRISSDEKIRLEDIAMKMILGPNSKRYKAYIEYKEKKTPHDIAIKVADSIEWILDLLERNAKQSFLDEGIESADKTLIKYKDGYKDLWLPFVDRLRQPNGRELVLKFYLGRQITP